jgi:hypothetical protein
LLRARRERPCGCCAAEQRDELASFQVIEFHSVPCTARAGLQDTELARISQRPTTAYCPALFSLSVVRRGLVAFEARGEFNVLIWLFFRCECAIFPFAIAQRVRVFAAQPVRFSITA